MEDDSGPFHDLLPTNEKKFIGQDNELIGLLCQNGRMVFNNQTQCRNLPTVFETKRTQKPESLLQCGGFLVNSCNFNEDESVSWLQGTDNSVDKGFLDFFYEMPASELSHTDQAIREDINACTKQSSFHPQVKTACHLNSSLEDANIIKFSKPGATGFGVANRNFGEEKSSCGIARTVPFSICGNTVEQKNSRLRSVQVSLQANINEPVIALSSEDSGFSFVRTSSQITTKHSYKRKERNMGKSECIEEAEYDSAEESKRAQKPESGRRSRAAEVHNLSERRRRDRINEKMRELQDLIPHSKKIDKVSLLDEAIEYLKSLRLQLQSMWMRNGMAPLSFPSIHHHMLCMALGMNHHPITSIQRPIQLSEAPSSDVSMPGTSTLNQPPVCPLQDSSSTNFTTQMQNFCLPAQSSGYLGFPQMQIPQVHLWATNDAGKSDNCCS